MCVINIHAGHHGDIYRFDRHLVKILKKHPKYSGRIKKIIYKLRTYDIVMASDFNNSLKSVEDDCYRILTDSLFCIKGGKKMYRINNNPTCCDPKLSGKNLKLAFDHILSTFPKDQIANDNIIYPIITSDHVPIISTIFKIVGYDFDGVLHLDVTEPDSIGQRNPIKNMVHIYHLMVL
jgi:hypothetical protein